MNTKPHSALRSPRSTPHAPRWALLLALLSTLNPQLSTLLVPAARGANTFAGTGPLATARRGHTATLLANGKVLVVGGYNDSSGPLASAELYDPVHGEFAVAVP